MQFEVQKTCFGGAEVRGGPTPSLCSQCEIRHDCENEARDLHRRAGYEEGNTEGKKSLSKEKISRRVEERDRLNVLWEDTKAAKQAEQLRQARIPAGHRQDTTLSYTGQDTTLSYAGSFTTGNPLQQKRPEVRDEEDEDFIDEETEMAQDTKKESTLASTLASTGSKALKAVKRGAATAAVDEIGEELVDIAKEVLPSDTVAVLAGSPEGRSLLKGGMALVLLHLSGTETLADYPGVESACTLELEAVSRDLVQPRLAKLRGSLGRLSALGRKSA